MIDDLDKANRKRKEAEYSSDILTEDSDAEKTKRRFLYYIFVIIGGASILAIISFKQSADTDCWFSAFSYISLFP